MDGRSRSKITPMQFSSVFREAMRGLVPAAILGRQDKIGFATPEKAWLDAIGFWIDRNRSKIHHLPMLNLKQIDEDWEFVRNGKRRFDFRIWRWNNLAVWADFFNVVFE